jgi:S1-C subfamily serine protease
MSEASPRLPIIAIGLAVTAVVLAIVATIVVVGRGDRVPQSVAVAAPPPPAAPESRTVAAIDVAELERNVVEPVSLQGQVIGVKVTDASVRGSLGLAPADVITGISGRPIRRQFDIYDALVGASTMNATSLFVELVHDGAPLLVRWQLDGDLRQARRGRPTRPTLATPSLRPVRDPLLDTINEIDDHHYVVPRATIEQLAANASVFAQGARMIAAVKFGRPDGIRLFIIRPSSALWALGLRNGDTVQSVNGVVLTDPARVQEVYDQIKDATLIRIGLIRRGTQEVIEITQTP